MTVENQEVQRSDVKQESNFNLRWANEIEGFKRIIKTLAKIQEEITFKVTPDGLAYRAMDPSHVALIDLTLSASDFERYGCSRESKFTVRVQDFLTRLERGNKDDVLELSMSEADRLNVVIKGRRTKAFSLYTIESTSAEVPTPKLNFDVNFSMSEKDLSETLKDIETTCNHVTIESDCERVTFSGKGDSGIVKDEFADLEQAVIKDSSATYSIEYLRNFLSTLKPENLTLEYSSKMPLRMTVHPVEKGNSVLQYYLAPRVQE